MDTSGKSLKPGDPNSSTTSSCFSGITDAESEEIKRKRNLLSVKATNAIAVFHALRSEVPSEANVNYRGDADQKVEVLTRELSQWQAEALAFADEFDTDALRVKYKKRVMNHVRREKKKMSVMLTLYDADDEFTLPLEPFMGLMQEQVYGVDTGAPTPCLTADSTMAGDQQTGSGVDPTTLTNKLHAIAEEQSGDQEVAAAPEDDEKTHYTRLKAAATKTLSAAKDAVTSKMATPKGREKRGLPASVQPRGSKSARGEDDQRIDGEQEGAEGGEEGQEEGVEIVGESSKGPAKNRKIIKPKKSLPTVNESEEMNTEEIKVQPSQEQPVVVEADEQKKEEIKRLRQELEEAKKRAEGLEERLKSTEREKEQAKEREEEEKRKNEESERKRKEKEEEEERAKREEEKRRRKEEANKEADREMEALKKELAERNEREKEMEDRNAKLDMERIEHVQKAKGWARERQRRLEQKKVECQQQSETTTQQMHTQQQQNDQQQRQQQQQQLQYQQRQLQHQNIQTTETQGQQKIDSDRESHKLQPPVDNFFRAASRTTAPNTSPIPAIGSLSSTPIASNTIEIVSRRKGHQSVNGQVVREIPAQNFMEKLERDEAELREPRTNQEVGQEREGEKKREFFQEREQGERGQEEEKKEEKKRKREEKKLRRQKKASGRWWSNGFDEGDESDSDEEVEIPKKVAKVLSGEDIKKIRLAREAVREGRPKNESEKLSIEDPKDFIVFRQRFEAVCNIDGLDDEEKLKELGFWTKGAAKKMIESNFDSPDPTKALASAWRQLSIMFKAVVTTPLQRLEPVFKKGQLQSDSITSHFETLADIRVIYNEAHRSGSHKEFDRIDVLRETVDKKLACYRIKFWENQTREKKEDENHKTRFLDIIDFIAEKAETASLMGSLVKQPSKPQKTININATETEQQTSQTGPSQPNNQQRQTQQQRTKCAGCSMTNHPTKECHKLMRMDPDKLNDLAKELYICFRCGETGHSAKSCKQPRPVCKTCGNTHLTIFHAFLIKRNKENLEKEKEKKNPAQPSTQNQLNRGGQTNQAQNPIHNNTTSAAVGGEQPKAGVAAGEGQGGSGGQPPEL